MKLRLEPYGISPPRPSMNTDFTTFPKEDTQRGECQNFFRFLRGREKKDFSRQVMSPTEAALKLPAAQRPCTRGMV